MTVVVYGSCPSCGKPEPYGVLCYSDTGERVVPCRCGSRKKPVA